MKKILFPLLALVMILGITATGCGKKEDLVMATNASFPPYEYYEGTKIVGIDAEIAEAIAKKLKMNLVIEDTEFGSIIAGVQSGKYDFGMAGMTVNDERKQSVNFTTTYATGKQVIIVKEGSAIKSVDDLSSSIKIGVQQDTTGHIYCEDDYGKDAVVAYKTGNDAVQALITNKVDCVVIDNEPAKAYVAQNSGLTILETEYVIEDYAICIAKNNTDLLNKVNDALAELQADGTIKSILDKYIKA
jgi:polar amino acid transport system substrate-binding protein